MFKGGKGLHVLLLICLACCKPSQVQANIDGKKLLTWCESLVSTNGDPYLSGLCVGFLVGAFQSPDMRANITSELLTNDEIKVGLSNYHAITQKLYCIPPEATAHEIARVVNKHIKANPMSLDQPAAAALIMSVALAYPCTNTVNEAASEVDSEGNANKEEASSGSVKSTNDKNNVNKLKGKDE